MTTNKTLPGECSHCKAPFEFPAEAITTMGECPHCGKQTRLFLVIQQPDSGDSRKMVIWTVVGISILVLGFFAALYSVHLAKQLAEERRQHSLHDGQDTPK